MPRVVKKNFNSNKRFIRDLAKAQSPGYQVSNATLSVLDELERIAFEKLTENLVELMSLKRPRPVTLTQREVETKIALSFNNDFAVRLVTAGNKAVLASKMKKEVKQEESE